MSGDNKLENLFGSKSRVRLLSLFFNNKQKEFNVNTVAKLAKTNLHLTSLELRNLESIGIISSEKKGNALYYRCVLSSPLSEYLQKIFVESTWASWERPAKMCHLLLTLEASYLPMKEYYGYSMPEAHVVFQYDNVSWFYKMEQFKELGKKLLPIYQKRKAQIWRDFYKYGNAIGRQKSFKSFYENYVNFWKVAYITEFVSFYIDSLLQPGEHIVIGGRSFTEEYENATENLAKLVRDGKYTIEKIDVSAIVKQFFWIRNSYHSEHYLTEEEVRVDVRRKVSDPNTIIPSTPPEPKSLSKSILSVGKDMIYMQDQRKMYMMKATYYIHNFLKLFGKKNGIKPSVLEQIMPQELLITKNLNKMLPTLLLRQRACTVTYSPEAGITAFSGEIFFPKDFDIKPHLEINGTVACGGKAAGPVKVILKPEDVYKVNHGDVIVAPMTSPDLMAAIRRSEAMVTDFGGITCHAAVISRELNIPCVTGTGNASSLLHDGDFIEVDADNGKVRILRTAKI